jgi:hypothetical protein
MGLFAVDLTTTRLNMRNSIEESSSTLISSRSMYHPFDGVLLPSIRSCHHGFPSPCSVAPPLGSRRAGAGRFVGRGVMRRLVLFVHGVVVRRDRDEGCEEKN